MIYIEAIKEIALAFLVGGMICVLGQILMDVFNLTPAHTMCILVVTGAFLGVTGIYGYLVDFAGAGATTPITNFGNSLVEGAWKEYNNYGLIGVLTGIFNITGGGVGAAVIFSFFAALITKTKS